MTEHDDVSVQTQATQETNRQETLSDSSRWLAALSYVCIGSLLVLYEIRQRPRDSFVSFHARQGFALFFVEIVLLILYFVLDNSLGAVKVLGALVMIVYRLAAGLATVGLSVWGFVEALGGERWEMPFLASYAKRVPVDQRFGA